MTNDSPRRRPPLVVLLLGLLMFATLSAPARAAEDVDEGPTDDGRPEVSLRLSPAVIDVPAEAGPSEHQLQVENLGSRPLDIVAELSEFTATEDGTTHFVPSDGASATSWVQLDTWSFTLAPDERREVTITVDVPNSPEPGERYVSVIFAVPGADGAAGNISVTHRVAAKLYIDVPGTRIEQIELGQLTGPTLIDSGPATFSLTVHNRGNVHRRFQGDDRLLANSGAAQFPFENFTILGNSTRVVEAAWPDPPLLCWCTVEVQVDDGTGNVLTATTRVVAFPLRLTLAVLALTAGLALFAIGRRRRREALFEARLDKDRQQATRTATGTRGDRRSAQTPAARPPDDQPRSAAEELFNPAPEDSPAKAASRRGQAPTESPEERLLFTAHNAGGRQRPRGKRR